MILLFFLSLQVHAAANFDQALGTMIDTNVDVRIQRTKVAASEAQLLAARGAFTPNVALQVQEQNSGGNATSFSGTTVYPTAQVYSASATWNIFRSGSDVAQLRAANKDLSLQNSQLDNVILQAEDKAGRALIDLIAKTMVVESFKTSEKSAKHFAEIAQNRFEHSLLAREEADKVAIDAGNAESKRTDAELQLNDARQTVEALLGTTAADLPTEWPWLTRLSLENATDLLADQAEAKALEQRPDLQAAQFSYQSEDARDRALWRAMLPTVDLNYAVGETHMSGQTISSWSGVAMLTIPLWSGLHDYAAYRVQVENRNAADVRMSQLKRDIASAVKSAQANYRITVEQYHSRQKNLELARHILDQDGQRLKMGRADANDLDLDLRRVTEAENLAIQGIAQAHVAYMSLLHAFGQKVP